MQKEYKKKDIILVDDDPTNQIIGLKTLEKCYNVITLNSGMRLLYKKLKQTLKN